MIDIVQSAVWALRRLNGPAGYPPAAAAPYGPGEAFPEFPAPEPGAAGVVGAGAVGVVVRDSSNTCCTTVSRATATSPATKSTRCW